MDDLETVTEVAQCYLPTLKPSSQACLHTGHPQPGGTSANQGRFLDPRRGSPLLTLSVASSIPNVWPPGFAQESDQEPYPGLASSPPNSRAMFDQGTHALVP